MGVLPPEMEVVEGQPRERDATEILLIFIPLQHNCQKRTLDVPVCDTTLVSLRRREVENRRILLGKTDAVW